MLKKITGNSLPLNAHIEVSGKCQLNCRYCSNRLKASNRQKMPIAEFKRVLDSISSLKSVTLTIMNEPLLNDELPQLVHEAKKRNIRVGFPTNGVTFPQPLQLDLIRAGVDSIAFSVDSMDPSVFASMRHPAKLDSVLDNIRAFIENRNQVKSTCKISITAVLTSELLSEIDSFVTRSLALGVDRIEFRFPHRWSGTNEDRVPSVDARSALQRLEDVKKSYGDKIRYFYRPESFSKIRCPRPFNSTAIKVDGQVVPCCLQASDPVSCRLGNIYEEEFYVIWDGDPYQMFRNPFLGGGWPKICEGCTVLNGLNDNPTKTALSFVSTAMIDFLLKSGIAGERTLKALQKYPI